MKNEQKKEVEQTKQPYKKKLKTLDIAPMQFIKEDMQRQANKLRNRMCANGNVELKEAGEAVPEGSKDGNKKPYYTIALDKEKCQNKRRNGSKYCQVCSDKHAAEVKSDNK